MTEFVMPTLDKNLKPHCRERSHFDENNHFQYIYIYFWGILSLGLKFIFIWQDKSPDFFCT